MFDSFFESAKETIRRAGALDGSSKMKDDGVKAGVASVPADPDRDSAIKGDRFTPPTESEVGARERNVDSTSTAMTSSAASAAASSLSRSFSRLKASGATSVSKAMLPLKKALGSDPEAAGARASLVKYKGDLSVALAEATSTATKRRDERDLLTRALAGQDHDLQSWGYLSVLPAFREHRRHETNRAHLRMSIAEQEAELLSSKRQDVNTVLRSMPVIGPWTPSGLPRSAWVGMGMYGGEDDATGFHFDEKAFVIDPDVLLAMDEGLASKRQLLVLCDRECAAAAEALAEKVSEAGGLEPRSPQDRAEVLLSLLTRYHVLGEALNSTGAAVTTHAVKSKEAPKRTKASAVKETASEAEGSSPLEGVFSERIANTESDRTGVNDDCTPDGDACGETPAGDASASDSAGTSDIIDNSAAEADPRSQWAGSSCDSRDLKAPIGVDKGIKDAPEGVDAPQADALSLRAQGTSVNCGVEDETAPHFFGDENSPAISVEHNAENKELSPGIPVQWPAPASPTATLGPEIKRSAGNEGGGAANVNGHEAFGPRADDGLLDVGAFRESRKKCEEAFLELMSDERTREGRLVKRFVIMLHAKKSPNTSTQGPVSACPDMPSGPALPFTVEDHTGASATLNRAKGGGRCRTIDERLTTVKKISKSVPGAGDGWEQEAAVGPQVVKAFINYFSKDYLGKRFDVPDLLIPSLTELVESLVFRRARRVVFGYNQLRVNRDDFVWREKAEQMRELSPLELGIPPEYIPTCYGKASSNADSSLEQPLTCGALVNSDDRTLGVVAGGSASNSAVGRECVVAAEGVRVMDDATERRMQGVSHEACPRGDETEDQGKPTSGNEDFAVVPAAPTSEGIDASATAVDEASKATPTTNLSAGRDMAEEEDNVDVAVEGGVGVPYECVWQEFGRLGSCTTPAEMLEVVEAAMTLLAKEAARISGSDVHLDADTLLPLLVYVLVQADLPRVHQVLNLLRNFRGPSWRGEQAYYVTCIEAAVSFVVEWGSDGFKGKPDRLASPADTSKSSGAGAVAAGSFIDGYGRACQDRMTDEGGGVAFLGCGQNGGGRGRETTPREYDRQGVELAEEERKRAEGLKDLMRLGIFLDNHEVQEDTVDVLSSAGYL